MRERNRPLVHMYLSCSPPLKKLEPLKLVPLPDSPESQQEPVGNVQSKIQSTIKLFERLQLHTPKHTSPQFEIPCGIQSFYLLSRLKSHDPLFNLKVPITFVLNCGFKNPVQLYNNEAEQLLFEPLEGARNLKELALARLSERVTAAGVQVPVAVLKFNKGKKLIKWIIMSIKDLNNQWPEFTTDSVIQQYIPPKGLQASKTRVILRGEAVNVFKWTSSTRMDSKSDYRPQKQHSKAPSLSSTDTLEFTVLNHRRILKAIEADSYDEVVRRSLNKSMFLTKNEEAKHIFELFKNSPRARKARLPQTQVESTLTARYITHHDPIKCEVHKCNPASYDRICSQTKLLKNLIQRIYLKNQRIIEELVVDFIQGAGGEWYFLGIKQAQLGQKAEVALNKQLPAFSKCKGIYCKMPEDKLAITLSQQSESEHILSELGCKDFLDIPKALSKQQLHKMSKKWLSDPDTLADPMNLHSDEIVLVCTLCYNLYTAVMRNKQLPQRIRRSSIFRHSASTAVLPEHELHRPILRQTGKS